MNGNNLRKMNIDDNASWDGGADDNNIAQAQMVAAVVPAEDSFSFEDSERFEEDSLCSWLSDPESLTNNWTGWTKPPLPASLTYTGGIADQTSSVVHLTSGSCTRRVLSLVELCSRTVAKQIPFGAVERFVPPVPEQLQIRIAFWSFPENEEDIRLYSCLANGNDDEYQKGEQLFCANSVKEMLQIGFHLSAVVELLSGQQTLTLNANNGRNTGSSGLHGGTSGLITSGANGFVSGAGTVVMSTATAESVTRYEVAIRLDRCHLVSCTCTCSALASWCAHVVAVCLSRINKPELVCMRAPVSESLSRLGRDQLQKFAQHLIYELPQKILPTAQRLLDELLDQKCEAVINKYAGAPDPTAGPAYNDDVSWCLNDGALQENIRKIITKFCVPAPTVLSDVNYLSSSAPPAVTEWQSLLQALVGRLPEGLWNLLSIVREMLRRHDCNAVSLLRIITDQCLSSDQVVLWWYQTKLSQALVGHHLFITTSCKAGFGNSATPQYSCAFLCDEIVALWRLAALCPSLSVDQRNGFGSIFKSYHLHVAEKVGRILANGPSDAFSRALLTKLPADSARFDFDSFPGFRQAFEACLLNWKDYITPGISYVTPKRIRDLSPLPSSNCYKNNGDMEILASRGAAPNCQIQFMPSSSNLSILRDFSFKSLSNAATYFKNGNVGSKGDFKVQGVGNGLAEFSKLSVMEDSALNSSDSSSDESGHTSGAGSSICEANKNSLNISLEKATTSNALQRKLRSNSTTSANERKLSNCAGSLTGRRTSTPEHTVAFEASKILPADEVERLYLYDTNVKIDCSRRKVFSRQSIADLVDDQFQNLKFNGDDFAVKFARSEALYAHGWAEQASILAVELAEEFLRNPPNLIANIPFSACNPLPHQMQQMSSKSNINRKKKRGFEMTVFVHPMAYKISNLASDTLQQIRFLCSVLSEDSAHQHLAFKIGLFGLELPRQPAATKFLEVKLNQEETALVEQLKQLPLAEKEMQLVRDRAHKLCNGFYSQQQLRPVLPLSLASFVFDTLCWSSDRFSIYRNHDDEQLGFDAAVAALGMRTCVAEAEHPLLCEGLRRLRGDLALTLLLRYKDQNDKVALIMDRLLDREMHLMYRHHTSNASFYLTHGHVSNQTLAAINHPQSASTVETLPSTANPAASVASYGNAANLHNDHMSSNNATTSALSINSLHRSCSGISIGSISTVDETHDDNNVCLEDSLLEDHSENRDETTSPFEWDDNYDEHQIRTDPSNSNATVDFTVSNTSSSGCFSARKHNSQPRNAELCLTSTVNHAINCNEAKNSCHAFPHSVSNIGCSRKPASIAVNVVSSPYGKFSRVKYITPSQPNQPSEAQAHFMIELAKTLLTKAGGNHSTSIFHSGTHVGNQHNTNGPHRGLHLCAFQIGLYGLGLHNRVSSNWLSRTYSQHVSWISGQAIEIGRVALRILMETWERHLTPTEVANLADKASQIRQDPHMVLSAAELALSALPHAHALNPTEIQRALVQCREQNTQMLERACLAVENAAKDFGVYPEVLFMVARQWYSLYQESGGNDQQQVVVPAQPASSLEFNVADVPPVVSSPAQQLPATAMVANMNAPAAAVMPNAVALAMSHPMMAASAGNHAAALALHGIYSPALPAPGITAASHAQQQHMAAAAVAAASMQGHHLLGSNHIFPPAATMPYPHPPPHPAASAAAALHYVATANFGTVSNGPQALQAANILQHAAAMQRTQHLYIPPQAHQAAAHFAMHFPTSAVPRLHMSLSTPNLGPNAAALAAANAYQFVAAAAVNANYTAPPPPPPHVHGQHYEDLAAHHQGQTRYLYIAYRVGMLAMETMGSRIHDDNRNYVKYAQNPPYGDDVKWLFGIAKKLGVVYLQHFCLAAAHSVVSPFVLYDLSLEAAQVLAPRNTPLNKALLHPHIQPLTHKCLQMFYHASQQKLSHPRFTPSDAEELIALVRAARQAFHQAPVSNLNFSDFMQQLRRQKACKKDLWNRLMTALNS